MAPLPGLPQTSSAISTIIRSFALYKPFRFFAVPGVVSGTLRAGDGDFNAPWSWHWEPESVHTPDLAIEVCDGRPSMVEDDLAYWLGTVKQFCPWGARVVRRER